MLFVAVFVVGALNTLAVGAIKASPFPFTVHQPDGTNITLYVKGNEFFNYYADSNGYPVVKMMSSMVTTENPADDTISQYVFATQTDASLNLQPTQYQVGKVNPETIPSLSSTVVTQVPLLEAAETADITSSFESFLGGVTELGLYRRRREMDGKAHEREERRRQITGGAITNLVLMIRWSDCPYAVRQGNDTGLPSVQV